MLTSWPSLRSTADAPSRISSTSSTTMQRLRLHGTELVSRNGAMCLAGDGALNTPKEVTPGEVTPNDVTPNEVTPNDVTPKGVTPEGVAVRAVATAPPPVPPRAGEPAKPPGVTDFALAGGFASVGGALTGQL